MSDSYMITNSWDDVTLVCCNRHAEPIPMVIQKGPSSLFYACPKYKDHDEDERACNNRLSLQDYTAMLQHLHKMIVEAELNDERLILTNYSWKDRKGTLFKVLQHDGNKLVIMVENKRAINS